MKRKGEKRAMMEVRWQAGSDAVLLGMAGFVKRPEGLRFEPIRKFVCGSEEREKKAHEQDEDGKDGTRSF